MRQERLNKILDDHKLYVESKGEKGEPAILEGFNLEGLDLEGAYLKEISMYNVILKDANLIDANLQYADLSSADLRGANLEGANLKEAYLRYANLKGAKFTIEIRDVVDLSYCYLTKDQLPWVALHPEFSRFYPSLTVFE